MHSPTYNIDFDNSVEFALALLAQGNGADEDDQRRACAHGRPPSELLDADGWPGDCAQLDDAA
jgi:hypothetical protein